MILYFLKTTLLLGLFYLLYLLVLKNNKTFRWNRVYLLVTSFLAFFIPLLNKITLVKKELIADAAKPIAITLDTIYIYADQIQTKELNFAKIFLGIYIVGFIWGFLRMILGFIVIKRVKQTSRLDKIENELIYFNQKIESPFSFNTNIYIPDHYKGKEVLPIIIKHEQAHIQLNHSLDKIYFTILQALYWCNPFVYLYHKEIELVHEFEADEFSTQSISTDDYVENLLKTIQYTQTPTLLAHHFFQHPLKTRITMLYKNYTQNILGKTGVILSGIIICITFMFMQSFGQTQNSTKKYKYRITKNTADTVEVENPVTKEVKFVITQKTSSDSVIYESVEELPKFACGKMSMMDFIQDNLIYPKECADQKIEGKVIMSFIIDQEGNVESYEVKKGADERLNSAARNLINSFPKWTPGKIKGKTVSMEMNLPVIFKLK